MNRFLLKLLAALVALALAALGLALLPAARRQAQMRRDARAIEVYRQTVDEMDAFESGSQLAQARQYSAALGPVRLADAFAPEADAADDAEYAAQLDPCGNGAMAVLEIPKLGASLPVYHGVSDAVLEKNVGHLPGTGLPVSGGAACVLAAENGTAAARLFSGLDRLIPGDCFYIRALRETQVFQVEQALETDAVELPDEALDADVCALMTRSADGGSRRLVVLGRRVPLRAAPLQDDTRLAPQWTARLIFAAPALLAGLILLAAVESVRRAVERRRLKRMKL